MSLDSYNGEPTLCPECKGDCNVPVNEQAAMILDIIECLYILEQKIDALDGQNNPLHTNRIMLQEYTKMKEVEMNNQEREDLMQKIEHLEKENARLRQRVKEQDEYILNMYECDRLQK